MGSIYKLVLASKLMMTVTILVTLAVFGVTTYNNDDDESTLSYHGIQFSHVLQSELLTMIPTLM